MGDGPTKVGESTGQLSALIDRLGRNLASPEELRAWEADRERNSRRDLLKASGIWTHLSARARKLLVSDGGDGAVRPLQLVRAWVAGQRPILLLAGPTDAGKTFAAAWALARHPGAYHASYDLVLSSRALFGGPDETFRRARERDLLVVDELGLEDDPDRARVTMEKILDARLSLPKRTLMITNLDHEPFLERYGDRVWSRIDGVGGAFAVPRAGFRARGEG